MEHPFPPRMAPDQAAEFQRRRRARNWALMAALLVTVALLYAIAIVKFKVH